jgi:folate-binding protein YgfZ
MSPQEQAAAVRRGAGIFRLPDRRVLAVRGADRVRWLDGMISNEVRGLGPDRSGCHAALLTRTGRIVAALHVLWRPDELWLELDAAAVTTTRGHLEKFIVADDVELQDRALERLGLEGPAARRVLEAAQGLLPSLDPHACADVRLAGHLVTLAAYGWSGESAFQLFGPPGSGAELAAALMEVGRSHGVIEAGPEALEILRIEAGVPRFGAELDESVLPDEARLEAAVSTTKGCYAGQEVVARLRSRGQVSHLLVGLHSEGESPLPEGAEVSLGRDRIGEVTSACRSPAAGAIALAFLRRPHHEPGTRVSVAGREARVVPLPFVAAGSA